jgi:protein-S-isoprenylcysteine O-methyltransferase Ste14
MTTMRSSGPRDSDTAAGPGMLERVPLRIRMVVYAVSFLGFVLVALPWLAYRIDVNLSRWHLEIGWLRLVGVALFLAFLGMYLYCSYVLSSRGRGPFVEFDPPREFVASGPYRWVRNPVAACLAGAVLGLAIALSSTGVFLLFLLGLPLAHMQVVLLEEPLLRKRFGASYEAYVRRVPRWIPRPPRPGGA